MFIHIGQKWSELFHCFQCTLTVVMHFLRRWLLHILASWWLTHVYYDATVGPVYPWIHGCLILSQLEVLRWCFFLLISQMLFGNPFFNSINDHTCSSSASNPHTHYYVSTCGNSESTKLASDFSHNLLSRKFREIRTLSLLFLFNMVYSCNFTHILLYHLSMPRHIKEC